MPRKKIDLIIMLLIGWNLVNAQSFKFDFGPGKTEWGYTQVLPETTYSAEKGYGFEFSSHLVGKSYDGKDALRDDYITSDRPFYFSVKLPEGNYNVKVTLGDKEGISVA